MTQIDRLDQRLTKLQQDTKNDYPTRAMVENYCRNLDAKMEKNFTPIEDFKKNKMLVSDKIDVIEEQMFEARKLLKNHTNHVTKLNK